MALLKWRNAVLSLGVTIDDTFLAETFATDTFWDKPEHIYWSFLLVSRRQRLRLSSLLKSQWSFDYFVSTYLGEPTACSTGISLQLTFWSKSSKQSIILLTIIEYVALDNPLIGNLLIRLSLLVIEERK